MQICRVLTFTVMVMPFVSGLRAQTQAAGHWEGSIQLPDKQLTIEVDIAQNDKGEWIGSINIPEQRLKAYPLSNVAVQAASLMFVMKGIPGEPTFKGKLSPDAQSVSGDFTQATANFPFTLKRTGDAKIEVPPKSTPVTAALSGNWEGTLEAGETKLRLVLKLANGPDGTATGTMVSVDQGGTEIPITTITQTGDNLKFDVRTVNGSFTGDFRKEPEQLSGQWTQNGGTLPLTFKRPPKPQTK